MSSNRIFILENGFFWGNIIIMSVVDLNHLGIVMYPDYNIVSIICGGNIGAKWDK